MRQRIKPDTRWTAGPTNFFGKRNILDSRPCRQHSSRRLQNPRLGLDRLLPWRSCLQICSTRYQLSSTIPHYLLPLPSRRRLSASTPQQSDDEFDEDDDFGDFEDFAAPREDLTSMLRNRSDTAKKLEAERRLKELQQAAVYIQTSLRKLETFLATVSPELESLDKLVAERKEHHARLEFKRQYHAVDSRLAALGKIQESLFEELYHIKYPMASLVESGLPTLEATLEDLAAQFRICRQALQICNLQSGRAVIEEGLSNVSYWVNESTQDLDRSFVAPQLSGRKNIDMLLQPKFEFIKSYTESQIVAHKFWNVNQDMYRLIEDLISISRRYKILYWDFVQSSNFVMKALHKYRYIRRVTEFDRPLGHTQVHQYASNLRHTGDQSDRRSRRLYGKSIVTFLNDWYRPRLTSRSPRDPELDIAWRYVDIIHPFDLEREYEKNTIYVTGIVVQMFLESESARTVAIARSLEHWISEFTLKASNFESEISMLRYITWVRLMTESKIHALGDVPDTVARGLFCSPNPLSQNREKFNWYVNTFSALSRSAIAYAHDAKTRKLDRMAHLTSKQAWGRKLKSTAQADRKHDRFKQPASSTAKSGTLRSSSSLRNASLKGGPEVPSKTTTLESALQKTGSRKRKEKSKAKLATSETTPPKDKSEAPSSTITPKTRVPEAEPKAPSTTTAPETEARVRTVGRRKRKAKSKAKIAASETVVSNDRPNASSSSSSSSTTTAPEVTARKVQFNKTMFTPPKREYSTSSRSISKDLYPAVNGPGEGPWQTVDEEALMANEPQDSQVISSQSSTPSFDNSVQFWSHKNHRNLVGNAITVHYCRTLESAERVAKLFSESPVIGFDLEWKAQASSSDGIKSNLSLLQIANQDRIALFHIAIFKTTNDNELTPPTLKKLLESVDTVKVGVNIKSDCTRVRRHLGIEVQSQFELSHLYKLVKYSQSNPKLVNKRVVNLSQQVEEILGLPLYKEDDVRCSDWSRPLDYTQVQYAACDPFACLCLYHALELKRKALDPIPPPPAYAELNLPILISSEDKTEVKNLEE